MKPVTTAALPIVLGITSSAVYNSIRELENLLDLALFGKDPSGV